MTFVSLELNLPIMDSDFVASFGLLFSFPQIFNVGKVQQELPKPRSRDDEQLSQIQCLLKASRPNCMMAIGDRLFPGFER